MSSSPDALRARIESLTALAVGHVTHDLVPGRVGAQGIRPGGSAWYAAGVWTGLGARARLCTAIGDDFAVASALDDIAWCGVRGGTTTTFHNVYDGDARVQYARARAPKIEPDTLPAAWRRCDALFLAPVLAELDAAAWCATVDAATVGLGIQGWLKARGPVDGRIVRVLWPDRLGVLTGVDAVFASDEDLDLDDPRARAHWHRVCERARIGFLTRGPDGCDVYVSGVRRVGVFPHAHVVDPTGAGDAFAAAALLALAAGTCSTDAARLGAAAASIVIEAPAGAAFSRLSEAWKRFADIPPRIL